MMQQLADLFAGLPTSPIPVNTTVSRITRDARRSAAGDLFVCLTGEHADGHDFAAEAYTRGTRLFLASRFLPLPTDAVQILCEDTAPLYPLLCARFFDNTHKKLRLLAITGTKGKTSTLFFLSAILRAAGISCGQIGTLGISCGDDTAPTCNTTPDAYLLHNAFFDFHKKGCDTAILEVSSQAIAKHRVDGLFFHRAIFTNLSVDHIGAGEHASFAEYRACKGEVLSRAEKTILNRDDPHFSFFSAQNAHYSTYGFATDADCRGISHTLTLGEADFSAACRLSFAEKEAALLLSTPGLYQCYNAMSAITCALSMNIPLSLAVNALRNVRIPGRFEVYPLSNGSTVIIDYAHNEAALRAVFTQIYRYPHKRLLVVIGSVGERSKLRRASMGELCAAYADVTIFTADTPCRESVREIAEEMQAGFHRKEHPKTGISHIIEDRAEAILFALSKAESGDFILLAGKGHETEMQAGEARIPFDERQLIRSALASPALSV